MKLLLLLLLMLVIAALVVPAQREGTEDGCAALASRARQMIDSTPPNLPPAAAEKARSELPAMLKDQVRQHLPILPPDAVCAAAYWLTYAQPDLLRRFAPRP